jgi:hypothetical protein
MPTEIGFATHQRYQFRKSFGVELVEKPGARLAQDRFTTQIEQLKIEQPAFKSRRHGWHPSPRNERHLLHWRDPLLSSRGLNKPRVLDYWFAPSLRSASAAFLRVASGMNDAPPLPA